jgi:hypothetical protein
MSVKQWGQLHSVQFDQSGVILGGTGHKLTLEEDHWLRFPTAWSLSTTAVTVLLSKEIHYNLDTANPYLGISQQDQHQIELNAMNIGGIDQSDVRFSHGITILTGRNATN